MSLDVFLAVLAAAALHAGWNAVLKVKIEPFLAMALVNGAAGLMGLVLLAVTGPPAMASWGWLAASTALHLAYFLCLTEAYRHADMGVVYPIARGTAPLATALGSLVLLHEGLTAQATAGIAVLGLGIGLLAVGGGRKVPAKGVAYALATAMTITSYTLTDGLGARASGSPHAYTAALFVLDGLALCGFTFARRGWSAVAPMRSALWPGVAGGAMSLGAYWIAIWAMTVAPIPLVAAVRETSVLWATVIAVVILKEPLKAYRVVSAALIVAGLVIMRVG
jgi:drug/metabolite transporter (DMT)-like permease